MAERTYTLRELEAELIKHSVQLAHSGHGRRSDDGTIQWGGFPVNTFSPVATVAEADGITFLCPKCFTENSGSVGTHSVHVYFEGRGVPSALGVNGEGKTVRWRVKAGTTIDDLAIEPSIQLIGGCAWHGFIGHSDVPAGSAG